MSALEKRAWLTLVGMCPAYVAYFYVQAAHPEILTTMWARLACFAAASLTHAVIYGLGVLILSIVERRDPLTADERDRAIDGRASRVAYYFLIFGVILVGMVLPFERSGWQIVNAALLVIVCAETIRNMMIIGGYRARRSLA